MRTTACALLGLLSVTAAGCREGGPSARPGGFIAWETSETRAFERARAEARPMFVHFTAVWCAACKELEEKTFSDPRVTAEAERFVALQIDATNDENPEVEAIKGKYKVAGLPTVIVRDRAGKEQKRVNEFIGPAEFAALLHGVE